MNIIIGGSAYQVASEFDVCSVLRSIGSAAPWPHPMNVTIGGSTYHIASKIDAEVFCSVLRAMGPAVLWPWLLRYA